MAVLFLLNDQLAEPFEHKLSWIDEMDAWQTAVLVALIPEVLSKLAAFLDGHFGIAEVLVNS